MQQPLKMWEFFLQNGDVVPFLSQTRVHLTCLERPFAAGQGSYWQHTRWGQALQRQHTFTFFPGRQEGKRNLFKLSDSNVQYIYWLLYGVWLKPRAQSNLKTGCA